MEEHKAIYGISDSAVVTYACDEHLETVIAEKLLRIPTVHVYKTRDGRICEREATDAKTN